MSKREEHSAAKAMWAAAAVAGTLVAGVVWAIVKMIG